MNRAYEPSSTPASPTPPAPGPTTAEDWELIRRSIAMLPPGAWAMRREQALDALSSLVKGLRNDRHSGAAKDSGAARDSGAAKDSGADQRERS